MSILTRIILVCFTPNGDQTADTERGRRRAKLGHRVASFDHLVGGGEPRLWHGEVDRLRGLEMIKSSNLVRVPSAHSPCGRCGWLSLARAALRLVVHAFE